MFGSVADVGKDGGTVERDDWREGPSTHGSLTVDTAHLLGDHDGRGTIVGPSNSGDSEAVGQTGKVGRTGRLSELLLVDDIGVVKVTRRDDRVRTKLEERLERLVVLPMLHEPSRGLWAKVDSDHEDERRDKGGTKLETPGDPTRVLDNDIGAETKEDTWASGRVANGGTRLAHPQRPTAART